MDNRPPDPQTPPRDPFEALHVMSVLLLMAQWLKTYLQNLCRYLSHGPSGSSSSSGQWVHTWVPAEPRSAEGKGKDKGTAPFFHDGSAEKGKGKGKVKGLGEYDDCPTAKGKGKDKDKDKGKGKAPGKDNDGSAEKGKGKGARKSKSKTKGRSKDGDDKGGGSDNDDAKKKENVVSAIVGLESRLVLRSQRML